MRKLIIALVVTGKVLMADWQIPITSIHLSNNTNTKESHYTGFGYGKENKLEMNDKNFGLIYRHESNYKIGYYKNSLYKDTFLIGRDFFFNDYIGVNLSISTGYDYPIIGSLFLEYDYIRIDCAPYIDDSFDKTTLKPTRYYGIVFGFSLMFDLDLNKL